MAIMSSGKVPYKGTARYRVVNHSEYEETGDNPCHLYSYNKLRLSSRLLEASGKEVDRSDSLLYSEARASCQSVVTSGVQKCSLSHMTPVMP